MKRVEIFSDGVFAIAITLLVVELPFDKVGEDELAHALSEHWPSFAAYVLSFIGIGSAWLHHHAIFGAIDVVDRPVLLLNMLLLLAAAFLPFPTALVGDYLRDGGEDARIAVVLYSANWVAVALSAMALCRYAFRRRRLLSPDVPTEGPGRLLRSFQVAAVLYTAFTALAVLSPVATIACYGVSALYFLWRSDYQALGKEPVE